MVQDFSHLEKFSFHYSNWLGKNFEQEDLEKINKYDSLFNELKSLETKYKNLDTNGLVTMGVGFQNDTPYDYDEGFSKIKMDGINYMLNPVELDSIKLPDWLEGQDSGDGIYLMYPDELQAFRRREYTTKKIPRPEGFRNRIKDLLNPKFSEANRLGSYNVLFEVKNISEYQTGQIRSGFRAIHPNTIVYPMYQEQYQKLEEIMASE